MRILVADDHAVFREGLRLMLASLADVVDVTEAGTQGETIELLNQNGTTPFNLILVDLGMPGMDAVVGLAEIKAQAGAVPVVVISASENPDDVRAAFTAGANGYIPKSVRSASMIAALTIILADRVYIRPSVLDNLVGSVDKAAEVASQDLRNSLTDRQIDVLRLLASGKPNKEIARELSLAEGTVRVHVNAVLKSLSARNRTEAALVARSAGLT
jgi:DNA-binding NarL/FixJ family response regulator